MSTLLGEGTFGSVRGHGKYAVKSFEHLTHQVQEVFVTKYMNGSPNTIKLIDHNFNNLTMTTERWHCSLKLAMEHHQFTNNERMSVFKCILEGLCYAQSYFIIHADLKSSNILIDKTYTKAAIADYGLSSTDDCAKVRQTAPAFRPIKPINDRSHDMFGLAVTMTELFGNAKMQYKLTPAKLRIMIDAYVKSEVIASILKSMVPDDPSKCSLAKDILYILYRLDINIEPKPIIYRENKLSTRRTELIEKNMRMLTKKHEIKKCRRCYICLLSHLNGAKMYDISDNRIFLYICSMLYIFSCIFGKKGGYTEEIFLYDMNNKYVIQDLLHVINNIINDPIVIDLMFAP